MPTFKFPAFKGDSLAGDKYMEDVRRTFTTHVMTSYIDGETFCSSHITRSKAFASKIRDYVVHNDILSFIATEE